VSTRASCRCPPGFLTLDAASVAVSAGICRIGSNIAQNQHYSRPQANAAAQIAGRTGSRQASVAALSLPAGRHIELDLDMK
jgi:hypothetical protein